MNLTYSIAIRTLGTAGEKFRRELQSISAQTVQPEKVVVYIAKGYPRPEFTVGREEYVWVAKGMHSQRVLRYDEITSDCILMLDDDVLLAPDSAEKMLKAVEAYDIDCLGADVFENHKMPLSAKLYTAAANLVFPHYSRKWAFKMHRNGSFSYNNRPVKSFYLSQTCGGPVMLWKKKTFLNMDMGDESWLDRLPFAYGDDTVESYKAYSWGARLGVLYDSGIVNLDAGTASSAYRRNPQRMYVRTKAQFLVWYRICYRTGKDTFGSRLLAVAAFALKSVWLIVPMSLAGRLGAYFRGMRDAFKTVRTVKLPPYVS